VVITCYNLEWGVGEAIASAVAQSALDAIGEIIVVDDGSTDGSRDVISAWAERRPDLVRPIFKPNGRFASALNAGIAAAGYPIIAFLDADDLWLPEKLALQLPDVARHPQVGLFMGGYLVELSPGVRREVRVADFHADDPDPLRTIFLKGGPILPTTALVRAEVFTTVGGFDEKQPYLVDEEMWGRIANRYRVHRTPGVLALKREHAANMSSNVLARVAALDKLTDAVLAMRPDLASEGAGRRLRVGLMAGKARLDLGQTAEARREFRAAWRARPTSRKALAWLVVSHLTRDVRSWVDRAKAVKAVLRLRRA
jgi:glycosyltransferase involved in cell wall biosynthesis